MLEKLLPRDVSFFDFFEKHASIIVEAAKEFLFNITEGHSFSHPNGIKHLEHQADEIVHSCVEALHKTFITPIEREDIHRLLSRMDDIVDDIDAAAACLVIYKIQAITPELKTMAQLLYDAVLEVQMGIKGLRNMKNADEIRKNCTRINLLENKADAVLLKAVGRLFDDEQDIRNVIKWKEIYENVEDAIDRCEDVADIIEDIILDYT